jgi:hypothetical protein
MRPIHCEDEPAGCDRSQVMTPKCSLGCMVGAAGGSFPIPMGLDAAPKRVLDAKKAARPTEFLRNYQNDRYTNGLITNWAAAFFWEGMASDYL